jgi:predicted ester cyclase
MAGTEAAEVVQRLHRALRGPDGLDAAEDLFAPDFVSHTLPPGLPPGRAGVRIWYEMLRAAFPDLIVEIDELVSAGDRAATATTLRGTHTGELMGIAPSGRSVAVTGIDIVRVADGRIVEHRGLTDTVGLLRQISAGEEPEPG